MKHIQDTSKARVDIDQSTVPRKITITGTAENVARAVGMVRDVLSYPNAQVRGEEGKALSPGKEMPLPQAAMAPLSPEQQKQESQAKSKAEAQAKAKAEAEALAQTVKAKQKQIQVRTRAGVHWKLQRRGKSTDRF